MTDGVSDGTVDITIEAYTEGQVIQTTTMTPTDIILVLDVSGSMDDTFSSSTSITYTPVNGMHREWTTLLGSHLGDLYGLHDNRDYYIQINGEYQQVEPSTEKIEKSSYFRTYTEYGYDQNGYSYFYLADDNTTNKTRYYPNMTDQYASVETDVPSGSNIVQFYTRTASTTGTSRLEQIAVLFKLFELCGYPIKGNSE